MIETEIIMTAYPVEFQRRCQQKWEGRAGPGLYESAQRMPWLLAIGQMLRADLDGLEQPVSERLAALLKELDRPTAIIGISLTYGCESEKLPGCQTELSVLTYHCCHEHEMNR